MAFMTNPLTRVYAHPQNPELSRTSSLQSPEGFNFLGGSPAIPASFRGQSGNLTLHVHKGAISQGMLIFPQEGVSKSRLRIIDPA